jgi:hypothetical protein
VQATAPRSTAAATGIASSLYMVRYPLPNSRSQWTIKINCDGDTSIKAASPGLIVPEESVKSGRCGRSATMRAPTNPKPVGERSRG